MKLRLMLVLLSFLLGLPLVGYLWPISVPQAVSDKQQSWAVPEVALARKPISAPDNLAVFWPGKKPVLTTEADAGNSSEELGSAGRHAWTLVGVIRQGSQLSALVLDPKRNMLALKPGDHLDEHRRVSAIHPTSLSWQDREGKYGELPLYPNQAPK